MSSAQREINHRANVVNGLASTAPRAQPGQLAKLSLRVGLTRASRNILGLRAPRAEGFEREVKEKRSGNSVGQQRRWVCDIFSNRRGAGSFNGEIGEREERSSRESSAERG